MALFLFLLEVFVISFSGAMQPGPVTATAITMGTRNRYAGILLAVGHGIIEFPLMILIILGVGVVFESQIARVVIGLTGGAVLLLMGVNMFVGANSGKDTSAPVRKDRPIMAGIVLTASNPYFLIWWASVGLVLATRAVGFGIWAFAIFAIVHWLVDLIWVGTLSWVSFKGSTLLSGRSQRIILMICAAVMFSFGLMFIYGAATTLFFNS